MTAKREKLQQAPKAVPRTKQQSPKQTTQVKPQSSGSGGGTKKGRK